MNKTELVDRVQQNLGTECSKSHAEKVVNSVLSSIQEGLRSDRAVQLVGFGTFQVKQRAARTCRNPRTGETMQVGASQTVGFKPGQALKDSL
jgi:DNA-binding protein HU-beta